MSMTELENNFEAFLAELGYRLPKNRRSISCDKSGRVHDEQGNDAGMYTHYSPTRSVTGTDMIRVHIFSTSEKHIFHFGEQKRLSPAEKAEREKNEKARQARRTKRLKEMSAMALQEYNSLGVPAKFHFYLQKKNVPVLHGVKFALKELTLRDDEGNIRFEVKKGDLLIPTMTLDKQFSSYQKISGYGDKFFRPDAPKQGSVYPIGRFNINTKRVYLCEGYATGCSLQSITGETVLVCFDLGNIKAVAELLSKDFPHIEVIIASDYDATSKSQAGLIGALNIADQFDLKFVFPSTVVNGSDWNDLVQENPNLEEHKTLIDQQLIRFSKESIQNIILSYKPLIKPENLKRVYAFNESVSNVA